MIKWRLQRTGNVCRVEIDLPWDVAEKIAALAPALLAGLADIGIEYQETKTAAAASAANTELALKDRKREFARLGRRAYHHYRWFHSLAQGTAPEKRGKALKAVSRKLAISQSLLELYMRMHRSRLETRVERMRTTKVAAMLLQGGSNAQIAAAINTSVSTAARYIKQVRENWRRDGALPTVPASENSR